MGDVLSPPCFLTTLQYTKLHGKESLGIIFTTFPTFCKESLGINFPSVPTFCNESTGYPALDPTANKYLSGSGWEISVFCFYVFMFLCVSLSYMCVCLIVNAKA